MTVTLRAMLALVASFLILLCAGSSGALGFPALPQVAEDAGQLEALIQTSKGDITMRFFPTDAPKHVAHFIETARSGGFDGTVFHRAIAYAIVQGGDPISKDPKKRAMYGTGGLKLLPDEIGAAKHSAGAVSGVMLPGADGNPIPGSSGTQFFICDTSQPALDGKYSVFGWVTDGMDVVRAMTLAPATGGLIAERITISKVVIRPVSPTVEDLGKLKATLSTEAGDIVWEFLPTAPENARNFVRLARSGFYDGMTIYRALAGQLIQGASPDGWPQDSPNRKRSFSLWAVPDEFSTTIPMDRGIVGMAHGDQPNSATIHFFALAARAAHLDGKYTPFARVVSGMDVVDAISKQPVTGEKLTTPVHILKVTISS